MTWRMDLYHHSGSFGGFRIYVLERQVMLLCQRKGKGNASVSIFGNGLL